MSVNQHEVKLPIRRGMRPKDKNVSRLLPRVLDLSVSSVPSLNCHCVNSPFNLKRLVYESEVLGDNRLYLFEGLTVTYPTRKFKQRFLDSVGKHVPASLKELTFRDIGIPNVENDKVFGTSDSTDEVDGVSSMVVFTVPVYSKDKNSIRDAIYKVVDDIYVFGYVLTSIDELEHDEREDVSVLLVQFEARFSKDRFHFADVLHHVAPMRYLAKIRKQGLVPKSKSKEFKYEDKVYLFNECPIDLVLSYGKYKSEDIGDDGFCLFPIQSKNLKSLESYKNGKLKLYVDQGFETGNNTQALFTYGNIPLSVIDDHCLLYRANNGYKNPQNLNFKTMEFAT